MAVWYEIEPSETSIHTFLECNWYLHDFKLETVKYSVSHDCIDVYLQYDRGTPGRLLRFVWIRKVNIRTDRGYDDTDWIWDSRIFLTDHHSMVRVEDSCDTEENCREKFDFIRDSTTWIEADRIFWAVTDPYGKLIEMPADLIDQTSNNYGKVTVEHFDLKPYTGNMDVILKMDYARDRRHI